MTNAMRRLKADYEIFLASKLGMPVSQGINRTVHDISDVLFPFQRLLVSWALRKGRAALFAGTGLGKTLMQLEWARQLDVPTLIVAPLAVAQQTIAEAQKLSMDVRYAHSQSESAHFTITNYERLDRFDASQFQAVVLDESSIIKHEDAKTRDKVIEMFRGTPYRLACTATPAPNDIAEFANHAEFLGVCTRQEMLSMFFVHDDDGWRLKGHAREHFYRWMASWAMFLNHPRDIGFEEPGFDLPALNEHIHYLDDDSVAIAQAQGQLFSTGLHGIKGRLAVRRSSIEAKVEEAMRLVASDAGQWIIWHWLNDEGTRLARAIPDSVLVEGSQSLEEKTDRLSNWLAGRSRILVTKPSIAGFGLNLQQCHNILFMGLTDSWETYYQAVRRCWRYGQKDDVENHIILSESESVILENLKRKEAQAQETLQWMTMNINDYQREELGMVNISRNDYHTDDTSTEEYTLLLGDCVERLREQPSDSIDLSVFSPPFLSLYTYSDSERDMGNSQNEEQFFTHFGFLVQELLRVTKQGRLIACHVSQVPTKLVHDGFIGLRDFRGKTIQAFIDGGFDFHGEVVIDKNPQAQAIRTHAKGLLFKQLHKDASWLRPGLADFILLFRKQGESQVPILPDLTNDDWIKYAHPVWYDIRESDTLNVAEARTDQDERHIAPLQLETIKRCVRLWSNPGETVLSPFAGIGSEGYVSILNDRRFIGIELKQEYYDTARRNLDKALAQKTQVRLL